MRTLLLTLVLLTAALGLAGSASAGAPPDQVDCQESSVGTGVECTITLTPTCTSEQRVTLEEGHESDGHCH